MRKRKNYQQHLPLQAPEKCQKKKTTLCTWQTENDLCYGDSNRARIPVCVKSRSNIKKTIVIGRALSISQEGWDWSSFVHQSGGLWLARRRRAQGTTLTSCNLAPRSTFRWEFVGATFDHAPHDWPAVLFVYFILEASTNTCWADGWVPPICYSHPRH